MTSKDFLTLTLNALSLQKEIIHILESDSSLLVSCTDQTCFFINILESRQTFIHDNHTDNFSNDYLKTHTSKEFVQDLMNLVTVHPGFFLYFMVFSKLEEMNIIDSGLFFHILDNIVCYEQEFDDFIIGILNHYHLK